MGFFLPPSPRSVWPPNGVCPKTHKLHDTKLAELGHKCIALSCPDGSFLCVCLRCNAFSSGGYVRYLTKGCLGGPQHIISSKCYWNRILAGKHPKLDGVWLDVGSP